MFDDLNRTIEALLRAELADDVASQVSISFATPDDSFPSQGLPLPTINVFLFEIHENTALRELEPVPSGAATARRSSSVRRSASTVIIW